MIFSFGNENDFENVVLEIIKGMFSDYVVFIGIEFVVGDKKYGEMVYFEDIVEWVICGGSGWNEKNIDLIIVVD